jgi:molybdate transport system regulatory protein
MPRAGPLKIKLQLYVGDERAFGPGRADILAAIDQQGSISAAARNLGMSYRYGWMLVESMNQCFAEKLVDAAPGGKRGGGAVLTEAGRLVLAAYRSLERRIATSAMGDDLDLLRGMLKQDPASD